LQLVEDGLEFGGVGVFDGLLEGLGSPGFGFVRERRECYVVGWWDVQDGVQFGALEDESDMVDLAWEKGKYQSSQLDIWRGKSGKTRGMNEEFRR
jgi:hypothetical protein